MTKKATYIASSDVSTLTDFLAVALRVTKDDGNKKHLRKLQLKLQRSKVVAPEQMPKKVVAMNAKVRLRDLDRQEDLTYTLVYPINADLAENKISVLSPVGSAIVGQKVGDTIKSELPSGIIRLKIEDVL